MAGLESRYNVSKLNDPTGKHEECRYFVLDPQHDLYALQALKYYARIVEKAEPELSADLKAWTEGLANGR